MVLDSQTLQARTLLLHAMYLFGILKHASFPRKDYSSGYPWHYVLIVYFPLSLSLSLSNSLFLIKSDSPLPYLSMFSFNFKSFYEKRTSWFYHDRLLLPFISAFSIIQFTKLNCLLTLLLTFPSSKIARSKVTKSITNILSTQVANLIKVIRTDLKFA